MNLFHTVILGIVEGITEFLPISSTGHLVLTAHVLRVSQTDFLKSFEIAIQLGAILSVVVLYRRPFLTDFKVLKRLAMAFMPTAILGFFLYKPAKGLLFGNDKVVLWALFLGGIFLIVFELANRRVGAAAAGSANISYKQAFIIGLFQSIAIIPGVSRSAATICGGLMLGINRKTIVEFSFLLAVPTILAATGFDLVKSARTFSAREFIFLAAGSLAAFLLAMASIKFFVSFIQKNNFIPFGIYRIILALLFWLVK